MKGGEYMSKRYKIMLIDVAFGFALGLIIKAAAEK